MSTPSEPGSHDRSQADEPARKPLAARVAELRRQGSGIDDAYATAAREVRDAARAARSPR